MQTVRSWLERTVADAISLLDRQQEVRDLVAALSRPALHARTLAFLHPVTGQALAFVEEPPKDFQAALIALRTLRGPGP